jgi:hypothetical protein
MLTTKYDELEAIITRAMAWADQLHAAYQASVDNTRRLFNQAAFRKIFLGQNGVTSVEYTDGFRYLMGQEEMAEEPLSLKQRGGQRGGHRIASLP